MTALLFRSGPLAGRRVEVSAPFVIGREADITMDDPELSRRHVAIRPVGDGVEIEDLSSTNGTWVNEARTQGARRIGPGDVIRIGTSEVVVEVEVPRLPDPAAVADAAAAAPAQPVAPATAARAAETPPSFRSRSERASRRPATRSSVATWIAIAVIVADAIALILYFALR